MSRCVKDKDPADVDNMAGLEKKDT